jgi:hypothetical protein
VRVRRGGVSERRLSEAIASAGHHHLVDSRPLVLRFAVLAPFQLCDEHASEFGEARWWIIEYGHDAVSVFDAECDDRVVVGDATLEFPCEVVAVEQAREQLHLVASYLCPGEDHGAVDERIMRFLLPLYLAQRPGAVNAGG